MKFIVIVNMTASGKDFIVHKKGCRDITRALKKYTNGDDCYEIEGASVSDAITNDLVGYHDNDQGFDTESYQVEPCADKMIEQAGR